MPPPTLAPSKSLSEDGIPAQEFCNMNIVLKAENSPKRQICHLPPPRPDGTKVTYTIDVEEEMEEVQYVFYRLSHENIRRNVLLFHYYEVYD
jgi:hypothetical protein